MSTAVSKAGVIISAAVGVAFLALTGCASQQSGAATPANLPNNCKVVASCKGMSSCKARNSCKGRHSCSGKY